MSDNIDPYFLNNKNPSLQGFLEARYSSSVDLPALMNNYTKSLQNLGKGNYQDNIKEKAEALLVDYKKVRIIFLYCLWWCFKEAIGFFLIKAIGSTTKRVGDSDWLLADSRYGYWLTAYSHYFCSI
jgi:hypothetical protein